MLKKKLMYIIGIDYIPSVFIKFIINSIVCVWMYNIFE